MTRIIRFYGSSDDLFEVEGTKGREPDELSPSQMVQLFHNGEGMLVFARYADFHENAPGVWGIGIAPIDEDVPMGEWDVKIKSNKNGYSTELSIEVPEGTKITSIPDNSNFCEACGRDCECSPK